MLMTLEKHCTPPQKCSQVLSDSIFSWLFPLYLLYAYSFQVSPKASCFSVCSSNAVAPQDLAQHLSVSASPAQMLVTLYLLTRLELSPKAPKTYSGGILDVTASCLKNNSYSTNSKLNQSLLLLCKPFPMSSLITW